MLHRLSRIAGWLVLLVAMAPMGVVWAQPSSVLEDSLLMAEAEVGLGLLYNMEFEKAEAIFVQVGDRYPDHPVGPFLQALNTWWIILLDLTDESHDERFLEMMEEVIQRSERRLDANRFDLDAQYFIGAALGFRGRLRSNRKKWMKAAVDGKKALGYVRKLVEADPDNDDIYFGLGMYDYYAKVIPDKYPVLKPLTLLFPKGDRERGLAELQRVVDDGRFAQTEAAYFLAQIHFIYEEDFNQCLRYVRWLRERHPFNSFFHAFEGRTYARWGRWNQAGPVYQEVLARYEAGRSGYNAVIGAQALYYLGRADMAYRRFNDAVPYFDRLVALTESRPESDFYRVYGRLRQGMSYDALGRRDEARESYRQVLRLKDVSGSHERAREYLAKPYGRS